MALKTKPPKRTPATTSLGDVLVGVVLLFTVLRNLPAFWFLAPISYVGG